MFQEPLFPKDHHLTGYHYSGQSYRRTEAFFSLSSYLFLLLSLHMILLLLLRCFLDLYCEKMTNRAACVLLAGSDCWTAEEKRYFNKGISAYRKDFFMVQKLVCFLISLLQYKPFDQHK